MSNIEIVEKFLAALEAIDLPAAEALLDDNMVYENVGLSVDHGREAAINTLKGFMRFSDRFEIIMHAIAENGNIVLTERTDILSGPGIHLEFWVCGRFEVRDEKIVLWKDYFDRAAVTGQIAKSMPGFLTTGIWTKLVNR